ncbi:MAG: nucleoside-diphosphate kinase [Bacteroidetes bacterium]|nr:MAG: nucleoside-diphosphate kinase [Bacteroidota bacterium]
MSNDITFSIIKPDALGRGDAARILCRIAEAGFSIAALKMLHMTKTQAEGFYDVHRERPFFPALVEFMSSGPVMVMVLRHQNAVEEFRHLVGSTDPARAEPGTIRAEFGTDVRMNAVHGSDSPENALREASYFFSSIEIF